VHGRTIIADKKHFNSSKLLAVYDERVLLHIAVFQLGHFGEMHKATESGKR